MPKRKRSLAPGGDDDAAPFITTALTKRRKKSMHDDPTEICQELYDSIRNYKNSEGRVLCESFIRVPKRRLLPEYYDVISQPIDLMKIHHKLKNDEYEGVEEMGADLELMLNNAKMYYKRNTQEFSDATELWNHYQSAKTDLLNKVFGDDDEKVLDEPEKEQDESELETASTTTDNDDHGGQDDAPYEELFAAVATAKDGDRDMAAPFKLLPSKLAYADYYQIIKEPIDLKMIATKIQQADYTSLDDLEKDFLLMFKNARTFNAPNSLIYKDAGALKKIVVSKKNEIEAASKSARKLRPKRQSGLKLSQEYAELDYPPDEEQERAPDRSDDDEDEDDDGRLPAEENGMDEERLINFDEDESGAESSVADGEESVFWNLLKAVKNYRPQGQTLIDPFKRLPSRRSYPDYYDEIDRPISLGHIQKKIKRHQYETMEDLCDDLDLMFDNAQQYNTDESKIFKDAIRLQRFMRAEKKRMDSGVRNEMEEDDYASTPKRGPKARRTTPTPTGSDKPRPGPKRTQNPEELLRKRLWALFKTVHDYEEEGRPLIMIFMELPSKKDYPDYYQVISEPIDMAMIERKIIEDKYGTDQELVSDFELMFNNARHYNEENSQVYKDAEALEKLLKRKWRGMSPIVGMNVNRNQSLSGRQKPLSLQSRLTELYNAIKDYTDSRGRILSTPFMRLPPKSEYPNYYEIIKKPVDMQRINQRLTANQYENMDDMVQDFVLMFDNACRYNEPDSLIYKDALALQRVCLEKKAELSDDDGQMPDVRAIVQGMMMNLFISTYNHQDEEGRCYSDSFVEFFHQTELKDRTQTGAQSKPLTFDRIKRNINKGRYRRMDRFQQDMFEIFETARSGSRTDSQVFEDSVELQLFFIKYRDEICKNGEILLSPALSYTEKHLTADLEEMRKSKLPLEQKEDEEKRRLQQEQDSKKGHLDMSNSPEEGFVQNGVTYNVGDFVYLEARDKNLESHIVCIESIGRDESGEVQAYGTWMYRPKETYHHAFRKFLEKEVFRSDFADSFPLAKVLGKCFVLSVRDYFKSKPEGFEDRDVYVCESRYSTRHRCFKKIKVWQMPKNDTELVARPSVLPAIRVASVFADKQHHDDDDSQDTSPGEFLDKERETVVIESSAQEDQSLTHYEQLVLPENTYKLGDSVYVRSASTRPFVARIDKLWTDKAGNAFFHGPWFMNPSDVEHSPTRLFYRKEVFRSTIESTTPLLAVMGKCVVLALRDYLMCRPYEYNEDDIYLCESKYSDMDRTIRKLPKGLKKFQLSAKVVDDELFFFRKPLTPKKEPSPLLMKMQLEASYRDFDETSNDTQSLATFDDSASQYNQSFGPEMDMPYPQSDTPTQQFKKTGGMTKTVKKRANPSGYIIFAGETRKRITEENPDMTFGEISKIVGTKWRNLNKVEKERYEAMAKERAEENDKKDSADRAMEESLQMYPPQPGMAPVQGQGMPPQPGGPMPPGMYNQQYPQPYPPHFHPQAQTMAPPPQPTRPPSPMFVSVPARTQRLVHSEAYIKYIENLGQEERRRTPGWERDLSASQNNTQIRDPQKLPTSWLGVATDNQQETVTALWNLRDHMLKDALTISRVLQLECL